MSKLHQLIELLSDVDDITSVPPDPGARARLIQRAKLGIQWLASHDDAALGALLDEAASFFAHPPNTPS